jgi:hypothetical protein
MVEPEPEPEPAPTPRPKPLILPHRDSDDMRFSLLFRRFWLCQLLFASY